MLGCDVCRLALARPGTVFGEIEQARRRRIADHAARDCQLILWLEIPEVPDSGVSSEGSSEESSEESSAGIS